MKATALATILSLGLLPAAYAQDAEAAADRPDIPAEEEATLADCRIWVSTLGELVEAGEEEPAEGTVADAEAAQQEAMEACDAGNYYDGIITAAQAIDRLEGTDRLGEAGVVFEDDDGPATGADAETEAVSPDLGEDNETENDEDDDS